MSKKKNLTMRMATNQKIAVLEGKLAVNEGMTLRHMARALAMQNGNNRDMNKVLGYPDVLTFEHFLEMHTRQDMAKRVVNAKPDAIWSNWPTIEEDGDVKNKTEFELAFEQFAKRTKLYHHLHRLDILAGIGRYAVLLIGVRDGLELDKPVGKIESPDDIIYLMPFSEGNAKIKSYETDTKSPRYGLPTTYEIKLGGHTDGGANQMESKTAEVHWSRTHHIAEGMLGNNVFGTPTLECVYNRLIDLIKIVGGSAEIFWYNGRGGVNINMPAESQILDKEKVKKDIQDYADELKRVLLTKGMEVKTLEMDVKDPDKHFQVTVSCISGATSIPLRILIGAEAAKLASSQDENNWWARVDERRLNYCGPLILEPLIDMFIEMGALPPVAEYEIVWPDLTNASATEQADIAMKVASAIASYLNAGGELIMPPRDFVEKILKEEYNEQDLIDALNSEIAQMKADQLETERQQAEEAKNANTPPRT